jgi:hypothetical protein
MTRASTFAERAQARTLARDDAKRARKQAQARSPFAGWCRPGEILCLRSRPCRRCPGRLLVGIAAASQWPPDTGVARAHLLALESEDDFAIVEIADPQVKAAALDRDLLIAAHLREPEEVVP